MFLMKWVPFGLPYDIFSLLIYKLFKQYRESPVTVYVMLKERENLILHSQLMITFMKIGYLLDLLANFKNIA